ncbi:MAG: SDR family oxidoreductase [Planctomycetaceae bacterium]
MKILVIGAAGMIGRRLIARLLADGGFRDTHGQTIPGQKLTELTAFDVVPADLSDLIGGRDDIEVVHGSAVPKPLGQGRTVIRILTGDLSDAQQAASLVADRPDIIFHLAAIVSGEAEADFARGYRINLDGTRHLLEAIAAIDSYVPRLVFTSSIAVFGAPFPDAIGDDFHTTPLTSYGTQKAICELLLNDFSRRGMLDGVGIRLPTICVRPGRPNRAASGFFSNIIREPLAGQPAILPVSEDVRHWHASPRSAVGFLLHAATLDSRQLGSRRNLTMPGVSVTVGEQIASLRKIAGEEVVKLIRHEPDEAIIRMVAGWPQNFSPVRAQQLGFRADASFEEIIQAHIQDELS